MTSDVTSSIRPYVPAVDRLLHTPHLRAALAEHPRQEVLQIAREVLQEVRTGRLKVPEGSGREEVTLILGNEAARRVAKASPYSLRSVINATGVVLQPELGRAPLAKRAISHMVEIAARYSNAELKLPSGERGPCHEHVDNLLRELTGAEASLVVNNNAAAILLALASITRGKEVILSRGELIEIGGWLTMPEIVEQSGAKLVEVGSTNRTERRHYAAAIGDQTGLLLKVHASDFRMIGRTAGVPVSELVELGKERGIPVMHELGTGCITDVTPVGLPAHQTVRQALQSGADIVTFSGDKLLGGPQVGVIVGRREMIDRLERHPLLATYLADKLTLAAFEATLRIHRDGRAIQELPALQMLGTPLEQMRARVEAFARRLTAQLPPSAWVKIAHGSSEVGTSLPGVQLQSVHVAITPTGREYAEVERLLRESDPPVLVKESAGDILIDLRSVFADEEDTLIEVLARVLGPRASWYC